MEISAKTNSLIETGTAVTAGFFGFVSAATAKLNPKPNAFSKTGIEYALAMVVGGNNITRIDPSFGDNPIEPKLDFMGPFNDVTYAGIGLLAADWILKNEVPAKYYKNLDGVPSVVHGAGIGLLVGGIIGGLFDPPEPQLQVTYGKAAMSNAGVNVPNIRASGSAAGFGKQGGLSWS